MEWAPGVEERAENAEMEETKEEEVLPNILLPSGSSHANNYRGQCARENGIQGKTRAVGCGDHNN
jgi:hypothetical protein